MIGLDYDWVDCNGCGAGIRYVCEGGALIPDDSDCEFCREETACSGHLVWEHGELDKNGRTKLKTVPCSRTATVFDSEGREFYCDEGWKILHEGEDLHEMEEFAIRLPKD